MRKNWGLHLVTCAVLLFPAAAWAALLPGSPDDWAPSLVYDPADGSLRIDTGAGYGGPDPIYYVTVYSDYGIFNPIHASSYVTWYATDYELTTLQTEPLYDGDALGEPGFMFRNEDESFLLGDLTFIWQVEPFGDAFYGDLVYLSSTPELTGDLNDDGFVGITDLNIVLGAWNQNIPPGNESADPSGDGFVGIEDLNVVLGNWNAGAPPALPVPEPGTVALLALPIAVGLSRRIRK